MKKTFKKEQLDKVKIFAENFFWDADEIQTEGDTEFLGTTSLMLKDLSKEKRKEIKENVEKKFGDDLTDDVIVRIKEELMIDEENNEITYEGAVIEYKVLDEEDEYNVLSGLDQKFERHFEHMWEKDFG